MTWVRGPRGVCWDCSTLLSEASVSSGCVRVAIKLYL